MKIDKSEAYLIRQYVAARINTLQHHRKTKDFVKLHHKVKNKKLYRKFVPSLLNKFEGFVSVGSRMITMFLKSPDKVKPIIDRFAGLNVKGSLLEFLSKTNQISENQLSDAVEYNWIKDSKVGIEVVFTPGSKIQPNLTEPDNRDGLAN